MYACPIGEYVAGWEDTSYSQDPVFPPHPHIEYDESSTVPKLWLVRYQILNSSNNISFTEVA